MNHNMQILAERLAQVAGDEFGAGDRRKDPAPAAAEDWLTLEEAARRMRVSVKTFRTWNIPRFKAGKVVRVLARDLEEFIMARTRAGGGV